MVSPVTAVTTSSGRYPWASMLFSTMASQHSTVGRWEKVGEGESFEDVSVNRRACYIERGCYERMCCIEKLFYSVAVLSCHCDSSRERGIMIAYEPDM